MKLGLIGIGVMAENYIRLIVENRIQGAQICALCSRSAQHLQTVKEKYQLDGTRLFSDPAEMCASGTIDAVIICTPHLQHLEIASIAVAHDIHVLIEKPMAVSPAEAEAFCALLALHPKVVCGIAYCRRTAPVFQKAKEIRAQLGSLKRAVWIVTNMHRSDAYYHSASWRGTYRGEGGGVLLNQISHALDLYFWLCGAPQSVHAFCVNGAERDIEVENDAALYFLFANQATGQLVASTREFPGTDRLEIIGANGQMIIENGSKITWNQLTTPEPVCAHTCTENEPKIPYTQQIFSFENNMEQQWSSIVNDFIEAVALGVSPICSAGEGLLSVQVLSAAYLSSWTDTTQPVPCDADAFMQNLQARQKK